MKLFAESPPQINNIETIRNQIDIADGHSARLLIKTMIQRLRFQIKVEKKLIPPRLV
jgi:hypothetical protein